MTFCNPRCLSLIRAIVTDNLLKKENSLIVEKETGFPQVNCHLLERNQCINSSQTWGFKSRIRVSQAHEKFWNRSLDLLVCFDWILQPEYKGIVYIQGTMKAVWYRTYNIQDSTSSFGYMLPQWMEDTTTKKSQTCIGSVFQLRLLLNTVFFQCLLFSLCSAFSSDWVSSIPLQRLQNNLFKYHSLLKHSSPW